MSLLKRGDGEFMALGKLLRTGRFNELFFVDLPNQAEREAIWRIPIAKFRRDPGKFDIVRLAKVLAGLTGSEIEQVFIDALPEAFRRRTKQSLAELLAHRFPKELGDRLPPKRLPWASEDPRLDIFAAVALALMLRRK